jgi:hypothetical protein
VAVGSVNAARQRGHFDVSLMCGGEILVEWESGFGRQCLWQWLGWQWGDIRHLWLMEWQWMGGSGTIRCSPAVRSFGWLIYVMGRDIGQMGVCFGRQCVRLWLGWQWVMFWIGVAGGVVVDRWQWVQSMQLGSAVILVYH